MGKRKIRFIDSSYNELFKIPDGGHITIHYPDGHTENRMCKYIDTYHAYINGRCFHMCEFAEIMERNKCTYTLAEPEKFRLENITEKEFEFMFAPDKKDTERGCIGYLRADFNGDDCFFTNWFDETPGLKTNEFKVDFDEMLEYFRKNAATPLLKSRSDMYYTCFVLKPKAYNGNERVKGFKIETGEYTYYLKCNPHHGEYNLYCYCYKTKLLRKYMNLQVVNEHHTQTNSDKFFVRDDKVIEVYYNPDADAGGQLVYNEIYADLIRNAADTSKNTDEFFEIIASGCVQYLIDIDTPEFKENFISFALKEADFQGESDKTVEGLKRFAGII